MPVYTPYKIDYKQVAERLLQAMQVLGIKSKRQIALSIGCVETYFNRFLRGETTMSDKYLQAIEVHFGINKQWLISGTGEMLLKDIVLKPNEETVVEQLTKRVALLEKELAALKLQISPSL